MEALREMMMTGAYGTQSPGSGWIEHPMAITGRAHDARVDRAADHWCHKPADVPGEGIDFAPFALDSTEKA
jgi:hypothetical protein